MGAAKVERVKAKATMEMKDEKWLKKAFAGSIVKLNCAWIFSLLCSLTIFISAPFTPLFFNGFGPVLMFDKVRTALTIAPNWIGGAYLFFRTVRVDRIKGWRDLADKTEGQSLFFALHFIVICFMSLWRLHELTLIDDDTLDKWNPDLSGACVSTLLNWFVCLFFTLLHVRTSIDQTRAAEFMEALDMLKWNGKFDDDFECTVEVTKRLKTAFNTKMRQISEHMLFDQSVYSLSWEYLFAFTSIALISSVFGFVELMFNWDWSHLSFVLFSLFHLFIFSSILFNHFDMKRISFRLGYLIIFLIVVAVLNLLVLYEASSGEFYKRCVGLWKGEKFHSKPYSMFEDMKNPTSKMARRSENILHGTVISVFLLHSIYALIYYVINVVRHSKPVYDETKEELV